MSNSFANFLLGLICTVGLFALCLIVVVGGKIIALTFKEKFLPKKTEPPPPPQKTRVIKRRKPKSPIPKPVRSIEIDPEQVDKIYVKKIS